MIASRRSTAARLAAAAALTAAAAAPVVHADEPPASDAPHTAVTPPVPLPAAPPRPTTRVAASNTTVVEARLDDGNDATGDDHYLLGLNRLNVTGNAGDISAQLRLDAFAFADLCAEASSDCVDVPAGPGEPYRNDFIVERVSVVYRRPQWSLTGGDFFQQLGRGIVLSVRKVDEAGVDLALQGALFEARNDVHRGSVFAARVNPANLDPVNHRFVEARDDIVAGHSYELRALPKVRIGTFGAFVAREDRVLPDQAERDWSYSHGVSFEVPSIGATSLYVEGDAQQRSIGGATDQGFAGYANVTTSVRDLTLTAEGIALDRFSQNGSGNSAVSGAPFRLNQPPTLERIDQETLNGPTVLGGRARLEQYLFDADTTLYANGVVLVQQRGSAAELRQVHGYAGFKTFYQDGSSRIEASGGYRDETQTNLPGEPRAFGTWYPGDRQLKSLAHGEVDWLQATGSRWSLHLAARHEQRTLDEAAYARGSVFAGADRSGTGGITFEFGYDTQNPEARNLFFAGIVKWELASNLTLTSTVGTQRGGIKCVNGLCRDYPSFAGARAELAARF